MHAALDPTSKPSRASAYFTFTLLFLLYMFDYIDRMVVVSLFPFLQERLGPHRCPVRPPGLGGILVDSHLYASHFHPHRPMESQEMHRPHVVGLGGCHHRLRLCPVLPPDVYGPNGHRRG